MEHTKLKSRVFAIGINLYTTNFKGVSSMRPYQELDITQKSAWFMLHRLRKAAEAGNVVFSDPVGVDEIYIGGKRSNMSKSRRQELKDTGRGAVGKAAVAGFKGRETGQVSAGAVDNTTRETLHSFVVRHVEGQASVHTDEATAYSGLTFNHEAVKPSVRKFVRGLANTNGIESFWSLFKRVYRVNYHKMSLKHLYRYVKEFQHRRNIREMGDIVVSMQGKRLRYRELVA